MFRRIARLAARFCNAPIATVTIVDRDTIWFLDAHGLGSVRQVPWDDGLCVAAIRGDAPYVLHDAQQDPQAAENQFVRDHQIRLYVGSPIINSDGHRLGTVAVMDTEQRSISDEQLGMLEDLAAVVMAQLELRRSSRQALSAERQLRDAAEYARDHARHDLDSAHVARADAQVAWDVARRARDHARQDRDDAIRERDIAEHDRDSIEEYATVLQRTLLPPLLPEIDGLSLASHYHPASPRQVGGDFYDVFALGDGRWAFFVGDVEGHGADAAVTTSLIRYTLRSAALHYSDPTHALAELNSVLVRELVPRRFCTVLFGTFVAGADGEGFDVTIATGGHLPALLLDPASRTVQQVRPSGGMLVGMFVNASFEACNVRLSPGQTLLFYTDGIVESRRARPPFDETGLAAYTAERAGFGAAGLISELATLIPKLEPDDDIALLAITAD